MSILMYHLIVYFPLAMRARGLKRFKRGEERKEGCPNLFCTQKDTCCMQKENQLE